MKSINPLDMLEIAFIVITVYGIYLEKYYYYFGNSNFMDDKMPERACSLFNGIIFIILGIYELSKGNYLMATVVIIVYVYNLYTEITLKIPRAIRIEDAKNKKEVIYTGCGREVLYDEYKDW